MSAWDKVKNFMGFETGEYEEEDERETFETPSYEQTQPRREQPRIVPNERRVKNPGVPGQMQVVIVKPERFDDVTAIADHINAHRSVLLNLETTDRDTCRRIIDFVSGAAYANHGNIKKVSGGTFMITPGEVGISGEEFMDEYSY